MLTRPFFKVAAGALFSFQGQSIKGRFLWWMAFCQRLQSFVAWPWNPRIIKLFFFSKKVFFSSGGSFHPILNLSTDKIRVFFREAETEVGTETSEQPLEIRRFIVLQPPSSPFIWISLFLAFSSLSSFLSLLSTFGSFLILIFNDDVCCRSLSLFLFLSFCSFFSFLSLIFFLFHFSFSFTHPFVSLLFTSHA